MRRQIIGQVRPIGCARPDDRHVDLFERLQTSLAGDLEPPNRLDLVAEELHAHRPIPVGREDVDNSAAKGKLAGQLHCRGVEQAVFHQPLGQPIDGHRAADVERSRLPLQGLAAGHRLQEALDAGDDELRRVRALQQFEQMQPLAEYFVLDRPLKRFRGGKSLRLEPGEERQVVDQFVDLIGLGAHDNERGGGVGGQRGRHQRAR